MQQEVEELLKLVRMHQDALSIMTKKIEELALSANHLESRVQDLESTVESLRET